MIAIYKIMGDNVPEVMDVAGAYYDEASKTLTLVSYANGLCDIDINNIDIYNAKRLIEKLYIAGYCDFTDYNATNVDDEEDD